MTGIGAYKGILEIAQLDVVSEGAYVRKDELQDRYVERSTFNALLAENAKLKATLTERAVTSRSNLRASLSALVAEGKDIQRKSGEELISDFNAWVQKGMQLSKLASDQTWTLFNNQVFFGVGGTVRGIKNPSQSQIERDIHERINKGVAILEGAIILLSSSSP